MSSKTTLVRKASVRVQGTAEMHFSQRSGHTRLNHVYHHQPLRVLVPYPVQDDVFSAVLATTSGGLVGGDHLSINIKVASGAQALVTTQAAEKVYRSTGEDCQVILDISAADRAWLEWCPHESIIFNGARLRRRLTIHIFGSGHVLAGGLLVFGRSAHGEALTYGLVHDEWSVRVNDRLVWADSLHLKGDLEALLAAPAGFENSKAAATLLYVGDDASSWQDFARRLIGGEGLRTGVTCFDNLLVARWLGHDASAVRQSYGMFWAAFRGVVRGLPPRMPSIWNM